MCIKVDPIETLICVIYFPNNKIMSPYGSSHNWSHQWCTNFPTWTSQDSGCHFFTKNFTDYFMCTVSDWLPESNNNQSSPNSTSDGNQNEHHHQKHNNWQQTLQYILYTLICVVIVLVLLTSVGLILKKRNARSGDEENIGKTGSTGRSKTALKTLTSKTTSTTRSGSGKVNTTAPKTKTKTPIGSKNGKTSTTPTTSPMRWRGGLCDRSNHLLSSAIYAK